MLRHKNIDQVCCAVLALTLLLTCGFMGAAASGLITGERTLGYENRLFDQSRVHTLDIVMDDWESFIDTCTSEEYSACSVVIDGENFGSVAIRGKGNTSLSSVKSYGNDRYSFKIEFDHYQSGKTYHGLDKLSLNNLIQDKTFMKDYLAYTLMNKMNVAAPLCSFVQISVNGEPWGLYLAVEGVEDGFLARNFGNDSGELYKPDSMSFGGGRGNGREFDMDAFREQFEESGEIPQAPEGMNPAQMFGEGFDFSQMPGGAEGMPQMPGGGMEMPQRGGAEIPAGMEGGNKERSRGMGGGMGSSDVMLQYVDDDPASYSNIFNNAKTDVSEADQQRLIASLKALSEAEDVSGVVDTEAVIRYLVVHNFLCNDDSYTGNMVHNYYLYEDDGVLSMIPWDYNLSFGAFNMGGRGGGSGATSSVNSPIDSPVSSGEISSRPMISWIFEDETYLNRYHELYGQFVADLLDSGWLTQEIDRVSALIAPYVEADENGFFDFEEFQTAVSTLKEFCALRGQSISGQLDGTIPSTMSEQNAGGDALVDASHVNPSDMGEFGMGGGGMEFQQMRFGRGDSQTEEASGGAAAAVGNAGFPAFPQGGFDGPFPGNGGSAMMAGNLPEGMGAPGMQPQGLTYERKAGMESPFGESAMAREAQEDSDGMVSQTGQMKLPDEWRAISTENAAASVWMLVGSVALLAAALVFAGFFKSNL